MWNIDIDTILKTPGLGGVMACAVITVLVVCYFLTIRWISKGREDDA